MFRLLKNRKKLLGMNARNLNFIRPNNLKKSKLIADDKILSKRVLKKAGLPVSRLIAKIRSLEELENFDWNSLPSSFALKPNRGFGGEGIVVVYGRKKGREDSWVKADGSIVTIDDLKSHIRNIIDGAYSLSNTPDSAFFEERLKLLKLFKPYAFKGIPDIRVIVYNKVPVMAMLRLPTKESGGKANLQQGAIGLGIDLATGTTTTAVLGKGKIIEYLPGTRLLLSGIRIPYWKDMLKFAVQAQEVSGLGFLGADVAIDNERGPVFLELNARPGLSIQIANLSGLKERLDRVKGIKIKTVERGVRMGMDLFGGEIEEEVEDISGRKIIGLTQKVKLIGRGNKIVEVDAKIDTGAAFSSIDLDIARKLGFEETVEGYLKAEKPFEEIKHMTKEQRWEMFKHIPYIESTVPIHSSSGSTYRPTIRVDISLDGMVLPARVTIIDRSKLKFAMIMGKKNLSRFLVDVTK